MKMLRNILFIIAFTYANSQCGTHEKEENAQGAVFIFNLGPTETRVETNYGNRITVDEEQTGLTDDRNTTEACNCEAYPTNTWVIRNPKSGYVLDISNLQLVVRKYSGGPTQIWKLMKVEGSKYIIVSHDNKVLNINGNSSNRVTLTALRGQTGDAKQQWIVNSDNTISSAAVNEVLDICQEQLNPGNLIVHSKHRKWNQIFIFEGKLY